MELAEVVGQLSGLRRFAVRSLGGEAPDEAWIHGSGLAGDRVFDLFDQSAYSTLREMQLLGGPHDPAMAGDGLECG